MVKLLREDLRERAQETFAVVLLNTASEVLGIVEVAVGGIGSVSVDPRLVLGAALAGGAPRMVLAHNHLGSAVNPSVDDDALTARMLRAAAEVGVKVLDHVIIGVEGQSYSYEAHGRMTS